MSEEIRYMTFDELMEGAVPSTSFERARESFLEDLRKEREMYGCDLVLLREQQAWSWLMSGGMYRD
ncbi:hypothetical protein J4463_03465 [Candidatus Pacearchaeota archaeon]|nr:hypothetical protein [Candidatus Pacearchaeota archaeon]